MDRFDRLGDDAARVAAIPAGLLDATPDHALQAIVAEAARVAEAPIAAVSILLQRTQFFRAQVGMPADLAAAQATDRCVSFCQVVVATRGALEVVDAGSDERVPQDLVKRYGIRAYFGTPLVLDGNAVGSLCVIDLRPRAFSVEQKQALTQLAVVAVARLRELAAGSAAPADSSHEIAAVGLGSVRRELAGLLGSLLAARIASLEITSRMRGLEHAVHRLQPTASPTAVLVDAERATDDLERALVEIEAAAHRGARAARALETVAAAPAPLTVTEAVALAAAVSSEAREIRWAVAPPLAPVERLGAVSLIIAALMAARSREGSEAPLVLRALGRRPSVELRVTTASGEAADAITAALRATLAREVVWSDGSGFVIALPAA